MLSRYSTSIAIVSSGMRDKHILLNMLFSLSCNLPKLQLDVTIVTNTTPIRPRTMPSGTGHNLHDLRLVRFTLRAVPILFFYLDRHSTTQHRFFRFRLKRCYVVLHGANDANFLCYDGKYFLCKRINM